MSGRSITIVNAANVYAQNFLRNLRGYDRIILGDLYNNRNSFLTNIHKLRAQDPNTTIEHMNINSDLLLEQAIKPSNTVVYFTHDYFSLVPSKNQQLESTAYICKAYDVEKLVAVNPIEFINYFESDDPLDNPIEIENATHDKVLNEFKKSVVMRVNLVFGSNSYLLRYLQQNWLSNHAPFEAEQFKHFRFNPIHYTDMNEIINNVVNDTSNGLLGKKWSVGGHDSFSYLDINNMIKQTNHRGNTHTNVSNFWKKSYMSWQIFFHGNNHVNNMECMLNYLNHRNPDLKKSESLPSHLKYEFTQSFASYHMQEMDQEKLKTLEENLKNPVLYKYWRNSLD